MLGTSANCGLKVLICGFANGFLIANICGFPVKKFKSTASPQSNNIAGIVSLQFPKKIRFYSSRCRQIWVDVFIKHIPLPISPAVKRLFSMGAAILTAKRPSLTSRNFQWLVFLNGNLNFLKRQGFAQHDYDDMASTSSN